MMLVGKCGVATTADAGVLDLGAARLDLTSKIRRRSACNQKRLHAVFVGFDTSSLGCRHFDRRQWIPAVLLLGRGWILIGIIASARIEASKTEQRANCWPTRTNRERIIRKNAMVSAFFWLTHRSFAHETRQRFRSYLVTWELV
jgi:hypothetical protein